jgi:sulfur relay (sulfurtransferase) complex TusBCD TusD component (DsrE family)
MRITLLTARDPLRAGDGAHPARVAAQLADQGHDVTLVLLEDAVILARPGHREGKDLARATGAGVTVVADREALTRRGVKHDGGVLPRDLRDVVNLLVESDRQAWL